MWRTAAVDPAIAVPAGVDQFVMVLRLVEDHLDLDLADRRAGICAYSSIRSRMIRR